MVVGEAVFEAIVSPAFVAVYAGHEGCVDQGLAARFGALLFVGEDVGFGGEGCGGWWAAVGFCSPSCPGAGLGAGVGGFGAVIEAVFAGSGVSGPVVVGGYGWWDMPYPLQLSHRKGSRSSCRQKGIWQCAPIASTSPVSILL